MELGYIALALDMYGNGEAMKNPEQAGACSDAVAKNPEQAKTRFTAALKVARQRARVDPAKIGVIDYYCGGTVVLNMARMGVDLDRVVTFTTACRSMIRQSLAR